MSKVLVDRELLERLMRADADMGREGSASFTLDASDRLDMAWAELRAILAQPEDPEGFEIARHSKRLVEQLRSDLSAVTAERDRLQAALSAPDTIKAEPAGDYDNLRKQFLSLRMLANSNAKMVHHWRAQCDRETREALLANAASVNAERDTNSMLTDALETAERERDQLRAEVDALRKDAERYRWLRMADWWRSPLCVIRNPKEQAKPGSDCPSRTRLDEAVDAAMAAKEA